MGTNRKGLTLIELLIVLALLSVLITVGITSYIRSQKNARDSKRKVDLENIRQALELYRFDNASVYPTGENCESSVGGGPCICHGLGNATPITNECSGYKKSNTWLSDLDGGIPVLPSFLSTYIRNLPVDPINNEYYFYSYECTAGCTLYTIRARLETTGAFYDLQNP